MAEGLVAAVVFAVFTTVVRNQFPKWHILTHDDEILEFRETSKKEATYLVGNVCVLRFDGPLIFTSVHKFTKVCVKLGIFDRKSIVFCIVCLFFIKGCLR